MELKTYYDFAENDYKFFKNVFTRDDAPNSVGAIGQRICERYLKHAIDLYKEKNDNEFYEKNKVMKTNNLVMIMNFITKYKILEISDNVYDKICQANGLCTETMYPGGESVMLTDRNRVKIAEATQICRDLVTDKILK